MSFEALNWLWSMTENNTLSTTEVLLLSYIAYRADKNNEAWPSKRRISKETKMNIKTIYNAFKSLGLKGFLKDTGRRRGKLGRIIVYCLPGIKSNSASNGIIKNPDISNGTENGMFNGTENGMFNGTENGIQKLTLEITKGTDTRVSDSFEEFWDKYPKKINKEKCRKKWLTLSDFDHEKIMIDFPKRYATKEFRFVKQSDNYLSENKWTHPLDDDNPASASINSSAPDREVFMSDENRSRLSEHNRKQEMLGRIKKGKLSLELALATLKVDEKDDFLNALAA